MKPKWIITLFILGVCTLPSRGAETLFAHYFDINTGSSAGSEVTGKIHLLSNKDAHHATIQGTYTFNITSNPGGYFTVEDQRSVESRLFGALKVAPGKTLAATPTDYPLTVELTDGSTVLATVDLVVHAVAQTVHENAMAYLHGFPIAESRLFGRKYYGDSTVNSYINELESNNGEFSGFTFYTQDVMTYAGDGDDLKNEWMEVAKRIGGLGKAYYDSSTYGPGGNASERARLKAVLYDALEALLDRVPIEGEDVLVGGSPIGPDLGDGFMRLSDSSYRVISFNFASHGWEITDPLTGPALWLIPELYAEAQAGDARAIALHEKLIGIFQLTFANPPAYRQVNNTNARWDMLTDTNHTEGVFSDANLGHRSRGWMSMLGIWADYNRPITYVPYYYEGYYDAEAPAGFLYMPGWTPEGVLSDLEFWITHFHRPAHVFGQSGFQPDGTVSHHDDYASDIAMYAYGYDWLTDVISGYEMMRDMPVDLGSAGYQFIADRYLYSYDRIAYKNYFDYTVTGREYIAPDGTKLVDRMPGMIDRLLAAKQPGTVITNEAELVAWSNTIDNRTHQQSGNIPFWIGNYMVHRRGGGGETPYHLSVKMENDRTNGAEDFASVKKSWHAGSGILQAMVRGDEYDQTRRNMDWHALPGLTEEWRTDAIQYDGDSLPGGSTFSGMASDGRYGFAAMEYRSLGSYSVAEANKGFFFTETEAIAMGNSVNRRSSGQGREIITTIDQTLWDGTVTYSIDGASPSIISSSANPDLSLTVSAPSWIHQGDIGYVIFPDGSQPLYIRGGNQVNLTDPAWATGEDVIHFALGHGTNPTAGKYHYVIVPNKTAAQMPAYVNDLTNRIEVVSNESGLQGIYDSDLKMTQLAFYAPGTVALSTGQSISVDRDAMVQLREVGDNWSLSVTDPQHAYGFTEINLQISESLAPGTYDYELPGIYPMAGESMEVTALSGGVDVKVLLPDPTDDAAYNYQAELYAGAPLHVIIPISLPSAVIAVASDDFQSNTWSGGTGWSGDWAVTTGSGQPELDLLAGNYCVKLTRGDLNHSITRTLASPVADGTLVFKWDVDSLDSPAEYAYAEVFDGTWHTVWSMNSSGNGSDLKPTPDNLQEASVDLSAYGPVTQIRFSMSSSTSSGDYFYLDDVELRMTWYAVYETWALDYALSGEDAVLLADPDDDGRDNLYEFAIGSIPTNGADPAAMIPALGNITGSTVEYIHRRRTDHVDLDLDYWVERTTNLVEGAWITNGISISGTAPAETGFETVTNEVLLDSESQQFFRLRLRIER